MKSLYMLNHCGGIFMASLACSAACFRWSMMAIKNERVLVCDSDSGKHFSDVRQRDLARPLDRGRNMEAGSTEI
jgi:hypothetical protein